MPDLDAILDAAFLLEQALAEPEPVVEAPVIDVESVPEPPRKKGRMPGAVAALLAVALGLWAAPVVAQTTTTVVSTPSNLMLGLQMARSVTGASPVVANFAAAPYQQAMLWLTGTAGTDYSGQLEVSCDAGATWQNYPGVPHVTTLPASAILEPPPCWVRWYTHRCTGCTVDARLYHKGTLATVPSTTSTTTTTTTTSTTTTTAP